MGFFSDLFVSVPMREQAERLVERLVAVYPPHGKVKKAITPQAVESVLNKLYADVALFTMQQKLGVIRRAAFARTIQQLLFAQGYPAEVVTQITSALTMNALVATRTATLGK